jgi:hypothetical protein
MPAIGQYVIVRAKDDGVKCGEYQGHSGREVTLRKARTIYAWNGNRLELIDFSVVPGDCQLSRTAELDVLMLEACGIIEVPPRVEKFLRERKAHFDNDGEEEREE